MQKLCKIIVFVSLLIIIGDINHARFLWETLPHADLWLIEQLSLLFLSYVLLLKFVT